MREYSDYFAWSYEDMPGLDPSLVEHRLVLKLGAKPMKQKLRRFYPHMVMKMKEERLISCIRPYLFGLSFILGRWQISSMLLKNDGNV